jgi:transcriptional regulator
MRQNWPKEAPIPVERHDTIRRKITSLLDEGPRTARDLALDLRIPEKEIYDHLEHIRKTTHKGERRLSMEPAACERCGFVFSKRGRLKRPGRCPMCRAESIKEPVFSLVRPGG